MPEKYSYSGILTGATLVFYGYLGFDIMTTVAEEAENPVRDVRELVSTKLSMLWLFMF